MKLTIIGTGYVGLVTGVCFAELGHDVCCVDSDAGKLALLSAGKSPLFEPGLDELMARARAANRLHFSGNIEEAAREADVIFIAVGTPASAQDGQPDLSQVNAVIAPIARAAKAGAVVVVKSTVPIGTTRSLAAQVARFRPDVPLHLASNPEFLRQGSAVQDFLMPDRIVFGVDSLHARRVLEQLYTGFQDKGIPLLATTFESSEMIKYAANTMLAAKIAFINEIADICEQVNANIRDVARGVGLDPRIGAQFLQAGPGFGGSCFPKDTMALQGIANNHKLITPLVDGVVVSNLSRRERMLEKILRACGGGVRGKTLAILGLTFKPGTDDLRESISLYLIPELLARGAAIRAYDPEGMENAKRQLPETVVYAANAYDACEGADACILVTEWNEFRALELPRLAGGMRAPLMVDLRNIFKRRSAVAAGFRYISIGRAEVSPESPQVLDLLPEVELK